MTALLAVVGGVLLLGLIFGLVVAYRHARGPTPRRREYLRMLRQYRAAKLALHDITRRTRVWRPSLEEVGTAYANEVADIIARFDRQALDAELDRDANRLEETDREQR